jgi:hypothetical protein
LGLSSIAAVPMNPAMSSRRLKIVANDHGGKSLAFLQALLNAGHELVTDGGPADLLLIDLDPPLAGYQEMIGRYHSMGAKIVLYPHGLNPALCYDSLYEPDPRVDANLVIATGYAEFLRRIDYVAPVHTIGWSYCEPRPFRPCADVRNVLFAPVHPNADGSMAEIARDKNADVFARLLAGPWQLTVRHIGTLEENGLWAADGVTFVRGRLAAETAEIDAADAVVAAPGTLPALSIARGAPTIQYGGDEVFLGVPGETPVALRRSERYVDYIRYPFNADDGPLDELIEAAARSEAPIADWKRRFIGAPFNPRDFVALIERIAADRPASVQIDATRSRTTLAFPDELIERPELLEAYADRYGPDDDATLLLWSPGLDERTLLALAEQAIELAELAPERVPDILLVPLPGSSASDQALSERADALLSEWPSAGRIGELPRFGLVAAEH